MIVVVFIRYFKGMRLKNGGETMEEKEPIFNDFFCKLKVKDLKAILETLDDNTLVCVSRNSEYTAASIVVDGIHETKSLKGTPITKKCVIIGE